MMKRVATVLLALMLLACHALPPRPPVDEANVPAYIETHGEALAIEYARMHLDSVHPGGVGATSHEVVKREARALLARLGNEPTTEQHRRLKAMHKRLNAMP